MKHFLHYICLMLLMLAASIGAARAEKKTYQHIFTTKPATGAGQSLSGVNWTVAATNLYNYNTSNYAGVQIGSSGSNGSLTLTSAAWNFQGATTITEVRLWLNVGGTSITPTVTIGGKKTTSQGTVTKNSTAGKDWTKTSEVTFTPADGGTEGVVVINVETIKAGYICALEIDCVTDGSETGGSGSDSGGSEGGSDGDSSTDSGGSGTGTTPSTDGFVAVPRVTVGLDRAQVDVCRYLNLQGTRSVNAYDFRTTINGRSQKDHEYACVYRWLTFLKPGRYTVHVRKVGTDSTVGSEGDIIFNVVDPQGAPASYELQVSDVTLYIDALRLGLSGFTFSVLEDMIGRLLHKQH